jgi:hypothetical protein
MAVEYVDFQARGYQWSDAFGADRPMQEQQVSPALTASRESGRSLRRRDAVDGVAPELLDVPRELGHGPSSASSRSTFAAQMKSFSLRPPTA